METLPKICVRGLGTHRQPVWRPQLSRCSRQFFRIEGRFFPGASNFACRFPFRARALLSQESGQGSPIRAVPVQVAHELLNAGHRYLDVRTVEEYTSGHIEGSVNVPYMYKAAGGMTKSLKFLDEVSKKFGKDDEIVVGCQMGKRSHMAAEELVAAGFTGITDMAGGYMAWMQSGMPSKTSL